jgi:hypothetical protein
LQLTYKIEYESPSNRQIGDADGVSFNLPADLFPASSIEDTWNVEIAPAAEGPDLFESGQEAVADSDDYYDKYMSLLVLVKLLIFSMYSH